MKQITNPLSGRRPSLSIALGFALVAVHGVGAAQSDEGQKPSLHQQASAWLGELTQRAPADIEFLALDERVRVNPCQTAWQFDLPFGPGQALRARCTRPTQQVYLSHRANLQRIQPPASGKPTKEDARPAKMVRAPVPTRDLPQGARIQSADVQWAEIPEGPKVVGALNDLAPISYYETVRGIPAGSPLRKSDLRPIPLVKRGQMVKVEVAPNENVVITANLEAVTGGGWGDRVRLKNPQSGRQVEGIITGMGSARLF